MKIETKFEKVNFEVPKIRRYGIYIQKTCTVCVCVYLTAHYTNRGTIEIDQRIHTALTIEHLAHLLMTK